VKPPILWLPWWRQNIAGYRRLEARVVRALPRLVPVKMKKVLLAFMLLAGICSPVHGGGVSVITSNDAASLNEALKAFKDTVRQPIVAEYNIDGDVDRGRRILATIPEQTDLVFALGSPALQTVLGKKADLPVVYSMVPDPSTILGKGVENITGVDMNVPVMEVVEVVKSLKPPVQRLGVLSNGKREFAEAAVSAQSQGVQLVPVTVSSPREVSRALRSLVGTVDALWILRDDVILAPEVLEYILLWSYENKVPVVGLSEAHTRKGALLSLAPAGGREMGQRAGELANRILRGEKPATIPRMTSQPAKLTVNPKAAEKLGVELPQNILAKADNLVQAPVYEEGDWWTFRVTVEGTAPYNYHVAYRDGQFEDNDSVYGLGPPNTQVIYGRGQGHQELEFPLVPGKRWSFQKKARNTSRLRTSVHRVEVVGANAEPLKTLAGEFNVIELRKSFGGSDVTYFYSPRTKSVVRIMADHRMGGVTNNIDVYKSSVELMAYGNKRPGATWPVVNRYSVGEEPKTHSSEIDWSRVEAPVYKEGDWWVFRASVEGEAEEYRIEYKNGRFFSKEPGFLRGEEPFGNPKLLPWATVYLTDPQRKWLDFPLSKGKKWRFRYPRHNPVWNYEDVTDAWAEAVGAATRPVETEAGSFRAFEIQRVDELGGAWAKLAYFYSPETKSVVKLRADIKVYRLFTSGATQFELELLKYGNGPLDVVKLPKKK